MAKTSRLPTLKVHFNDLVLPVSKKKVKYRPFTVGEQKQIVQQKSKATTDTQAIILAMSVLQNCVEGIDIKSLNMFDFQKLFFEIRNSSEGADIHFKLTCEKCKAPSDTTLNLNDDLEVVNIETITKNIKIKDEDIVIHLEHPTVMEVLTARDGEGTDEEKAFKLIPKCIKMIKTGEETITDFVEKELEDFVDQFDSETFSQVVDFIKNGPAYAAKKPVICEYCKHEHLLTKEEVAGFFT